MNTDLITASVICIWLPTTVLLSVVVARLVSRRASSQSVAPSGAHPAHTGSPSSQQPLIVPLAVLATNVITVAVVFAALRVLASPSGGADDAPSVAIVQPQVLLDQRFPVRDDRWTYLPIYLPTAGQLTLTATVEAGEGVDVYLLPGAGRPQDPSSAEHYPPFAGRRTQFHVASLAMAQGTYSVAVKESSRANALRAADQAIVHVVLAVQ